MKNSTRYNRLLAVMLQTLAGLFILAACALQAAPGDVDALDAKCNDSVLASAVQPDGKIIIAGHFTSVQGVSRNYIARLNVDGTLDAAYDPSPNGAVHCVGVQPDGKIVFGGDFSGLRPNGAATSTTRYSLARVNADGSLDMSFDPDPQGVVNCLALQTDGKILIGGQFTSFRFKAWPQVFRSRFARLNADGSVDMGFDPSPDAEVSCVMPQADGKILLAGMFSSLKPNGAASSTPKRGIARVNADGTLDTGFAPNNVSTIDCMALQADGKILVGGYFTVPTFSGVIFTSKRNLVRLTDAGALDVSFDLDPNSSVRALAVQLDGGILAGGSFTNLKVNSDQTLSMRYIARLRGRHVLDSGFDPKPGRTVLNIGMQQDGKILLGGEFFSLQPNGAESPIFRSHFARLSNSAAEQGLTVLDSTQILWTRRGSGAEVHAVSFERSDDAGLTWTALGSASRVGTSGDWQLTGLNLPVSGLLRAIAAVHSGTGTSLFQSQANYHLTSGATLSAISPASGPLDGGTTVTITGTDLDTATDVFIGGVAAKDVVRVNATTLTATTPASRPGSVDVSIITASGTSTGAGIFTYVAPTPVVTVTTPIVWDKVTTLTITGANFSPTPGDNIVTFSPAGTGTVIDATPSTLTVSGITGLAPGELSAVVTTFGLSSGLPVQVAQVIPVPAGNLDPLDLTLSDGFLPNGFNTEVAVMAAQPDGKIIIGGKFKSVLGVFRNNLARLNTDGTLDMGFDPSPNNVITGLAVQADGRILVSGAFTSFRPNGASSSILRHSLARLNADGSVDAGFVPMMSPYSILSRVYSIALQADGKILIGGEFEMLEDLARYENIVRLHTDGSLDLSFHPNPSGFGVNSVVVQPDGKILIGGTLFSLQPHGVGPRIRRAFLARLNADGSVDLGFDPDTSISAECITLQADGKILLAGSMSSMSSSDGWSAKATRYIGRLNADGSLDESFDPQPNSKVSCIAVQTDGKILIGGGFASLQPRGVTSKIVRKNIARLNADGSLDMAFDPAPNSFVTCIGLQADGAILLGGSFSSLQPNGATKSVARAGFARLFNDPGIETLTAPDAGRVIWTRRGGLSEVSQVSFELSTDQGASWQMLGSGHRIGPTSDWQLAGLSLPASGLICARGRTIGGFNNSSSGLVEQVANIAPFNGRLSFAESLYVVAGGPSVPPVDIVVQRTGGTRGSIGCLINTEDGSALSPTHYTGQTNIPISYEDGIDGEQHISIPIMPTTDASKVRTFKVTLSSPSADTHLVTASSATVVILPPAAFTEKTRPTVTIAAPLKNALVSDKPIFKIHGTAKDNLGVKQVQVSLDGGDTFAEAQLTATGSAFTAYTFAMTPISGINHVQVRAIDFNGNASDWVRRSFTQLRTLKVNSSIPLSYRTLTAGFAPKSQRQVGKSYTVTATPKYDFVFNGWKVNDATGTGITPASAELRTLTFTFTEGLELSAYFITNPFTSSLVGTFNGLVLPDETTVPGVGNVGLLNLVVGTKGSFTGNLKIDGARLSFPGFFDNNGMARFGITRGTSLTLKRKGKPDLVIALQLDMTGSSARITGSVTQRLLGVVQGVSTVNAERVHYSSTNKVPEALSKRYTLVFPSKPQTPEIAANLYPQGTGYSIMTVKSGGTVSITGKLADNTTLTSSGPLSMLNQWSIFSTLYKGKGCFAGLATLADADSLTADVSGSDMLWLRPSMPAVQWYPAGWPSGIMIDLRGARYALPSAIPAASVFPGLNTPTANATLRFDGGLTETISKLITISPANAVTNVPTASSPTMIIEKSTGLIKGTFTHTDGTRPAYQGVIIQKSDFAGAWGFFMSRATPLTGLGQSGAVEVKAILP